MEHWKIIVVLLTTWTMLTCLTSGQTDVEFPPLSLVKLWTDKLSTQLVSALDNATGIAELKKLYEDENMGVEFIDGPALINDVADKWQAILQKKMTAVRRIVDKLEQGFANYTPIYDIVTEDVDYLNSKNLTNVSLTYDTTFKSDVNLNYSSVQIPTDIYEGDRVILNGIRATGDVDSVFIENFEEDPQLLWQYFGSADGFYRSYPAKLYVEEISSPFIARTRKWYIQATSSPKDVMILIDSSGSTFGMTLEIIKVSVSKALDTLGNDDFVSVAVFNNTVQNVSCFNTFVQANLRNKKVLNDAVQNTVTAGEIADFGLALEYAFKAFTAFNETERRGADANNQGADCIRVIMIFTDGGASTEEAIFEEYNRLPFVARVFVYKVGADSMVSSDGIKHMACHNKGYFSTIQSFGAVRLTTLDYVPVLSRPMVLSGKKNFQWSDIYLDALGLGMMTTLTLPVYNLTNYISQQLLGVVGTDITTKNMADTVPTNKIGPQAYVFGINSNGYILLHPRLKAELNYLSEPPNVDFLEVEYPTEKKEALRRDMIDRKNGSVWMETPLMSRDERYLEFVNMTYSFTFIDNTTFSVAIAQPDFDIYQFIASPTFSLGDSLDHILAKKSSFHLIAPWEFCVDFDGREGDITTEEIEEALQHSIANESKTGSLKSCDEAMVRKLLMDAKLTETLAEDYWTTKEADMGNNRILYVFAATQGGLTRIFPKEIPSGWSEDEKRAMQDPWEQGYYQRSLYTNKYVFSVPYNDGTGMYDSMTEFRSNITVAKSIALDNKVVPAVVGALIDPALFNESWAAITSLGFNNQTVEHSCADFDLKCYILDDGGFIIATNQPYEQDEVGRFFGEIDGDIMEDMTMKGFYSLKKMFDFQAACPRLPSIMSAGIKSWFVPTLSSVWNFNTWAASAAWTFIRHTFMDFLLFGWSDISTVHSTETVESLGNVSCVQLIKNFYYGNVSQYEATLNCVNCTRKWVASRIQGTNLAMVVAEMECDDCPQILYQQRPEEASGDDAPNPCLDVETPRYRRRPSENCYAFNAMENTTICSGTVRLSSPWILLVLHVTYLSIAWILPMMSS